MKPTSCGRDAQHSPRRTVVTRFYVRDAGIFTRSAAGQVCDCAYRAACGT